MKIAIHPYASEWPVVFEYEKYILLQALSELGVIIEHVGSTAVPNLSAKPVIDIMIGVPADHSIEDVIEPLIKLGYIYVRKYELFTPERRFFIRMDEHIKLDKTVVDLHDAAFDQAEYEHTHHIHVVPWGSKIWNDHIKFRDHLRNNASARLAYELLKKQLAENEWKSIIEYARAKSTFIQTILKET